MRINRARSIIAAVLLGAASAFATGAAGVGARHCTFGYDQPRTTAYGIAADIFADRLSELSHGTMRVDQYPGGQLGQEPQMLQKIRTGDIDFIISSTANAATIAPEAGVFSIHYIFRSSEHLATALADPKVFAAFRDMVADSVKGARALTLFNLGRRNFYSSRAIRSVSDLKGVRIRVQATPTEDALFPAYGAQVVHMPFGDVYTSLQTGVVAVAETGINPYLVNKHYEVAPVMSLSEHETNNSVMWISEKAWNSFSDAQKQWVQAEADEVGRTEPAKAQALDRDAQAKLEQSGVKFVKVDKESFIRIARPLQDRIARQLGPHAVEILGLVRAVQ